MPVRTASAEWKGDLATGTGEVSSESGHLSGPYSFGSRFEAGSGTNPEELIAAAHSGCFSMALANGLAKAGHTAKSVRTEGRVHLDKGESGFSISKVVLRTVVDAPGLSADELQREAAAAKKGCPVSRALASIEIEVEASLAD